MNEASRTVDSLQRTFDAVLEAYGRNPEKQNFIAGVVGPRPEFSGERVCEQIA